MTPTKLLIGQGIVVFSIILVGVWLATQMAATDLAYQSKLGSPGLKISSVPIYTPWRLFDC